MKAQIGVQPEEKINRVLKHIRHVQENCRLLGFKLMKEESMGDIGKNLIANSMLHDNSKFHGLEWDHLFWESGPELEFAISQHKRTNPHHPEYWGGIVHMPIVYIAEMVCDWKARSSEFGTDFADWITEGARKKYGYGLKSFTGNLICRFAAMLCDQPFTQKYEGKREGQDFTSRRNSGAGRFRVHSGKRRRQQKR